MLNRTNNKTINLFNNCKLKKEKNYKSLWKIKSQLKFQKRFFDFNQNKVMKNHIELQMKDQQTYL